MKTSTRQRFWLVAVLPLLALVLFGAVSALGGAADADPLLDSDGDGCTDQEEFLHLAQFGGLRDPANPWDFFDVNGDTVVNIIDIQRVAYRFGVTKGHPLYDPIYDRSVIGPNAWNLGPGDGVIILADIAAVMAQFGHQCGGPFLTLLEDFNPPLSNPPTVQPFETPPAGFASWEEVAQWVGDNTTSCGPSEGSCANGQESSSPPSGSWSQVGEGAWSSADPDAAGAEDAESESAGALFDPDFPAPKLPAEETPP